MSTLTLIVYGHPAPQGSKRHVGNGVMVESSKHVKPWREAVKHSALDAMAAADWQTVPRGVPVHLRLTVLHQRPASHFGTGRNATRLKDSAPWRKTTAPDLSKIIRSTEDALTDAGVWIDDALVAEITARDVWDTGPDRAVITITTTEETP